MIIPKGRLAQLVQSICLTSRGSGVRIPQRPQNKKEAASKRQFFLFTSDQIGDKQQNLRIFTLVRLA
jgi:hypothetical protein